MVKSTVVQHSSPAWRTPPGAVESAASTTARAVRVLPGAEYVTQRSDEMIVTLLGSCVAACVRDPQSGYGGLNHFMLPSTTAGSSMSDGAGRYGNFAMQRLIDKVVKSGCSLDALEIKLFGGADLTSSSLMVGTENVKFVLSYLKRFGIKPAAVDVGGGYARRIIYQPSTGRVMRQLLNPHDATETRSRSRVAC